ncbi:hypothetical protein [Snuella sedimenti]|uniref:Limonene hydroxylase n=1 Tax=Snuella sedimenti TaxID=2798802 RepID=A0A8J7JAL5_9FLAO|nr:hypothetical protein [Snuella sedimenti]MBJ6367519.1 hypothetical protein [Snuella sedimenti]
MIEWIKNLLENKKEFKVTKWQTDDSILRFLSENIEGDGTLKTSANDLPDEKKTDESGIRFAPGLMDSMFGVDDSSESKIKIKELSSLIKSIAKNGDAGSKSEFYKKITESDGVIGIIDEFLQKVVNLSLPIEPYLFSFAKNLATKTSHRNSVKMGIAILGLCQNKTVMNEIKVLGLHDEFTVFSTVAISNLSDNPVQDLWKLASKVDGWGKIQLVDRIANMELSEELKDWLILDGYKNSIMNEYLACTCAVNGELHKKIQNENIDNKLFKSTGEIIEALISGGPAEDISDYEFAHETVENFIRHGKIHVKDITDFNTLNSIKDFLIEIQDDIGEHKENGWTQDIVSNCLIDINEILKSKDWKEQAEIALKSDDNILYWNGKQAAQKLGLEFWDVLWSKLLKNPLDSSAWHDVTAYAKEQNVNDIIDFAKNNLPLEELGTGPKDWMGLGEDYQKHSSLDSVITFLENYPTKGEELILVGLDSPVTRNRNMTIRALSKWKPENWSDEITKKVNHLKDIEPNDDTKKNIGRLLKGLELE